MKSISLFIWVIVTLAITTWLIMKLYSEDKTVFLPGATMHGHHQIEMACSACHSESFSGDDVIQDACTGCHAEELKKVDDSHPRQKFTDPRNIDRVKHLDARVCVTCHTEHRPETTHYMGVTLPEDFCYHCHQDVAENRPSHTGMGFDTCASAGCHNFHDNTSLYEDFLVKHANEPDVLEEPQHQSLPDFTQYMLQADYPSDNYPQRQLGIESADHPAHINIEESTQVDTFLNSHSKAGVNCSACHSDSPGSWIEKPTHKTCNSCHASQTESFMQGMHGMRLEQEMTPLTPAMANLPMKQDSHDKELNCNSCHKPHSYELQKARTDSCLSCHDDEHSLAFKSSPHASVSISDTNMSCSTCHLPRLTENRHGDSFIYVDHNQNNTLRPNEKMIRPVCMDCHGLGFSIDALADEALIKNNFSGTPAKHIESIDMATQRETAKD